MIWIKVSPQDPGVMDEDLRVSPKDLSAIDRARNL